MNFKQNMIIIIIGLAIIQAVITLFYGFNLSYFLSTGFVLFGILLPNIYFDYKECEVGGFG